MPRCICIVACVGCSQGNAVTTGEGLTGSLLLYYEQARPTVSPCPFYTGRPWLCHTLRLSSVSVAAQQCAPTLCVP